MDSLSAAESNATALRNIRANIEKITLNAINAANQSSKPVLASNLGPSTGTLLRLQLTFLDNERATDAAQRVKDEVSKLIEPMPGSGKQEEAAHLLQEYLDDQRMERSCKAEAGAFLASPSPEERTGTSVHDDNAKIAREVELSVGVHLARLFGQRESQLTIMFEEAKAVLRDEMLAELGSESKRRDEQRQKQIEEITTRMQEHEDKMSAMCTQLKEEVASEFAEWEEQRRQQSDRLADEEALALTREKERVDVLRSELKAEVSVQVKARGKKLQAEASAFSFPLSGFNIEAARSDPNLLSEKRADEEDAAKKREWASLVNSLRKELREEMDSKFKQWKEKRQEVVKRGLAKIDADRTHEIEVLRKEVKAEAEATWRKIEDEQRKVLDAHVAEVAEAWQKVEEEAEAYYKKRMQKLTDRISACEKAALSFDAINGQHIELKKPRSIEERISNKSHRGSASFSEAMGEMNEGEMQDRPKPPGKSKQGRSSRFSSYWDGETWVPYGSRPE
ncbi:hypothetical protein HYDPIDRAFT_25769 [Hydnomerulius pinastri MD-312]|nr:hypothetical protein HYDPIDRAFT_25769 [Hydnomerulius pinastri MD-312]